MILLRILLFPVWLVSLLIKGIVYLVAGLFSWIPYLIGGVMLIGGVIGALTGGSTDAGVGEWILFAVFGGVVCLLPSIGVAVVVFIESFLHAIVFDD